MTKTCKITGWVLTVLLGLLFRASEVFKFAQAEPVLKQFGEIGL